MSHDARTCDACKADPLFGVIPAPCQATDVDRRLGQRIQAIERRFNRSYATIEEWNEAMSDKDAAYAALNAEHRT